MTRCRVRRVRATEAPGEPRVDGAEEKLSTLGTRSGTGHMVEQPLGLGSREVGIQDQSGLASHAIFVAGRLEVCTEIRCATILPDQRSVDGLPGLRIPEEAGLALVGDADGHNLHVADLVGPP